MWLGRGMAAPTTTSGSEHFRESPPTPTGPARGRLDGNSGGVESGFRPKMRQCKDARQALRMGKNVVHRPARDIKPDPVGEEAEASLRQGFAPLARQHRVELVLEGLHIDHVAIP